MLVGIGACSTQGDEPIGAAGVVGTPLLIAFKIPACVVTLGAAAPAAGAATLASQNDRERTLQRALEDGIRNNCGPPYVAGR